MTNLNNPREENVEEQVGPQTIAHKDLQEAEAEIHQKAEILQEANLRREIIILNSSQVNPNLQIKKSLNRIKRKEMMHFLW